MELWIFWSFGNSLVSITAISFVSLLAIYAVLSICFFARRRWIRGERPQDPHIHEFNGMSHHLVKVMPTVNFTAVVEGDCTSSICSICLEDYNLGEKLRILPCCHRFHAICVDVWLKSWRTFCPVCKRDARTSAGEPPASECTPFLLPSSLASTYASSVLSSVNLSSALQICSSSRYSSVSLPM